MKTFKLNAAQGEVNIRRVDALPDGLTPLNAEDGLLIVGHSESGHHHGFRPGPGIAVMERTKDVPAGMKILYAVLENPADMIQDAAAPHDPMHFEPGLYEFRLSREFDPFAEQARQVAD